MAIRVREVAECLVTMEMTLPKGLGPRSATEALELFALDPEGVAEIQAPPEHGLEDLVRSVSFVSLGTERTRMTIGCFRVAQPAASRA
jgi:hypothetical protein